MNALTLQYLHKIVEKYTRISHLYIYLYDLHVCCLITAENTLIRQLYISPIVLFEQIIFKLKNSLKTLNISVI